MSTEAMNWIANDRYCPAIAQTAALRTDIIAGSRPVPGSGSGGGAVTIRQPARG